MNVAATRVLALADDLQSRLGLACPCSIRLRGISSEDQFG